MSSRGAPRGRGGGFGGGRGGGAPRGMQTQITSPACEHATWVLVVFAGRGGYQQSYGPPAAVLGLPSSNPPF